MMKTRISLVLAIATLAGVAGAAQPGSTEVERGPQTEDIKAQLSRHEAVRQLVLKWGPSASRKQGVGIYEWADHMVPLFRTADLDNLNDALSEESYNGMVMTMTGSKQLNAAALPGGVAPASLGSMVEDLVFTPLPACVIVDTRFAGGIMSAGTIRHYRGSGPSFAAQGGSNTNCGIPAGVRALAVTATSVNATAKGGFRVWPFSTPMPSATLMSYGPTQNTQNSVVAQLTVGDVADFSVQTTATTHLAIAVVGFFAAPEATALQCTSVADPTPTVIAPNSVGNSTSGNCPAGYTIVGGECNTTFLTTRIVDEDINSANFNCEVFNGSVANETLSAVARCCRVPGR